MKNKAFPLIFLIFLSGCSLIKTEQGTPSTESEIKAKPLEETRAVFHVIDPVGVKFKLLNIESKKVVTISIDKSLSYLELSPGHWQISGFILQNRHFNMMNTSKHFIFKLSKNRSTYVGSYIIQCPKVGNSHLGEMKKMSFFNRYPYSSKKGLCEMVVGSDFNNVKKIWLESSPDKHQSLSIGF